MTGGKAARRSWDANEIEKSVNKVVSEAKVEKSSSNDNAAPKKGLGNVFGKKS